MAVRRVLSVQDKNEELKLRRKSNKVPSIDRGIVNLVVDMLDTLYEYDGVGLAAPQVGVTLRIVVIHLPEEKEPRILINPQIVKCSGEMTGDEGCLSVPGYAGEVTRYASITVKALNIHGKEERHKTTDPLFARALQHELDHLDGIMYYDRMPEDAHLKPVRRADEEEELAQEETASEKTPVTKKTSETKATDTSSKVTKTATKKSASTTTKKAASPASKEGKPAAKKSTTGTTEATVKKTAVKKTAVTTDKAVASESAAKKTTKRVAPTE